MEGAGGYAAARSVADQLSSLPPPHSSSDMNRAEKAALWSASERLEARAARDGRTAPPVAEEEWHVDTVHNVLLQFVAYAPTAGEPPPSAAFLTFQFFHFEPRTTPKALLEPPLSDGYRPAAASGGGGGGSGAQATLEGQRRAAAQGGGAVRGRQDALRLDVGLLTLGSGVLRDSQVGDLYVEIDVPGRDSLPPLRTATVKKAMSGRVELGYTHTEELPSGGRQAQELLKALRSRDEQDADVYFTLKTRDGRGQEKELGQGFVNLHEMLKANKDV